ncbi:hypothetical protein HELRODRAFT_73990 [Helobdella robusta]|uniref:Dolichyldiphosphatase n=1 Tax=Helobdella robusta TaxID=6412 RepID=T1G1K8_HELRO|nr:hypothetical protein HELRODRAFT_73990 [Helobdella robusta]ESO08963.1 hypothetical protein HELRODRAFT_73990 [Helobdella robusta]
MTIDTPNIKWKSISLTHVEYPEGDLVGLGLAWCSLLPIFILVSCGTLIAFRRDLHTIFFLIGLVVDEGLNFVLKSIIQEYRPMSRSVIFTEYGMPSSHAQFMSFFAVYMVLFLCIRVHHNSPTGIIWKHLSCIGVLIAALLVCYSRVYLLYHTIDQVTWGIVAGSVMGSIWFLNVHFIFSNYFPLIASWCISEYFMVRDLTPIPNVLWFEYCSYRAEAKSRQRMINNKKL